MKKLLSAFLTIALSVMLFVPTFAYAAEDNVLRIYNWEDYIAADDETGENLADEFQTWYNETYNANITVEYSTFGTNEIMYNELKIAPGSYDLVCPSDYMIQKMINENMVEEFSAEFLDASNETSYYSKYVSSYIKNLFGKYEVNGGKSWNNYAAAYMWGTMGYVFNPANVSSSDMKSWGAIWNIMYDNQSTLKDSVRDTFFIALAFVYRDELNTLAADYQNAVLQYNNGIIDEAQFNAKAKQYNDAISVILNRTDDETLAKVEAALNAAKQNIFGFEVDSGKKSQFVLSDNRSLDEVIGQLCEAGYLPSFCTGCYRLGRTGEHFMEFARPGFVKKFCTPNAVLTLLEYIEDYASVSTRNKALAAIEREISAIPENNPQKQILYRRMARIKSGERELFF